MRYPWYLCALVLALALAPAQAEWAVDVESGVADLASNDFRIPGDGGALVRLADDFAIDPVTFARVRVSYRRERETWSVLIAPLQFTGAGTLAQETRFTDVVFPAGSAVDATYRFNSYRVTYRRTYRPGQRFSYGFGGTLKVRDAKIALASGTQAASDANVGVVPLLNFSARWAVSERAALLLEGDALAAPQGRAEDVLLAVTYRLTPRATARVGYRVLEGGVDNDRVYNFALVNYAVVGLECRL